MLLGIDVLVANHFKSLNGMKVGLCTNSSACNSQLQPTMILFQQQQNFTLDVVFTPEHGLFGALQDQKKSFDFFDKKKNIKIHSLYGKRLAPDSAVIKKLDCIVIDLQDIGSRYYTFLWSTVLLIQQCALLKKKIIILDRPNPLNGVTLEGPVLEPDFSSFVGLYSIPVRHGLTLGELCTFINAEFKLSADITVVKMKLWQRCYYFDDTKLPWTIPSPNISEGRGTTRPFEIAGAPWIDPFLLIASLKKGKLPGVQVRPIFFIPTFNKYKNELCGGLHIYVRNRKKFNSVVTGLTIIKTIKNLYPKKFAWREPPYEFEKKKLPFDILIGNAWVREAMIRTESIVAIRKKWITGLTEFKKAREKYLLYK
jgi:uncharacterized protein YbbC (DUF1343 family)